jgi:anti-sigma B factor antagonist
MEDSMGMKATERQVSDVTILDISGRITLGDGTALFRNTTRDLISQGKKKLLLNLSQVPHIDSSGIAELVSAFVAARREGGDVKLLKLTKKVRDTVEIVHLGSIFELFDDEAAALKAFARKQNQEPDPLARAG